MNLLSSILYARQNFLQLILVILNCKSAVLKIYRFEIFRAFRKFCCDKTVEGKTIITPLYMTRLFQPIDRFDLVIY